MGKDEEEVVSEPTITVETGLDSGEGGYLFSKQEIVTEMKKQVVLAGPMVFSTLVFCLIQVISITFVGHLGVVQLSGASIATAFASMTGYTLLRGLGSALETFSGQAYGAKQYRMLGIHLQRGTLILLIFCIPIGALFANASRILVFFRQDPQISSEAGRFALFLIPVVVSVAFLECHIRFLLAQNHVVPLMVCSGISTSLHVPICWLLVFKSGFGSRGAAMANSVSFGIAAVFLVFYVQFSGSCKETWKDSLEVWFFEILILISGLLPNPKFETSVMSICFNIYLLVSMIPFGLGAAVSTRVSNELGAGRPRAASRAVCAGLILVVIEGIVVATILISGHNIWGYLYSKEKRIVKYVAEILVLLAFSHLLDGIQYVLSGGCRGCGWQKIGAVVNLGAYYFIGLPCSLVLAFVFHKGGKGLWIGVIVAILAQASSFLILTFFTDWEKQVKIFDFRTFRFAFGLQLS
ncbi:Protein DETOXIFICATION 15 [Linum grandiflorum]